MRSHLSTLLLASLAALASGLIYSPGFQILDEAEASLLVGRECPGDWDIDVPGCDIDECGCLPNDDPPCVADEGTSCTICDASANHRPYCREDEGGLYVECCTTENDDPEQQDYCGDKWQGQCDGFGACKPDEPVGTCPGIVVQARACDE